MILSNSFASNLQKAPFQNSSCFSHNLKVFEYMSLQKNHKNSSNPIAVNTNVVPSFFKCCVSLGNECMPGELGIVFYFCNVTMNKTETKKVKHTNIALGNFDGNRDILYGPNKLIRNE